MILSREMILRDIRFEPALDSLQVQACAVDLRLGEDVEFIVATGEKRHTIAKTLERIIMPKDVMGVIYPRSSLNRMNITLDATGIVDPGYEGHLVLPLTSWGSYCLLKKGTRIASIVFHTLYAPVEPRESKYQNSDGAYKVDKDEETFFLDNGDIEGLKKKFAI